MTSNYNIVAIIGKAGSGKDTVFSAVTAEDETLHKKISCTSRAPRDYEKDGVDYHFLSPLEFTNNTDQFIETQCFNDWWYGTRFKDLVPAPAINIGVFNIKGLEQIMKYDNISILPILISCPDNTRLIRQLSREENPNIQEIFRRYNADEKDFQSIPFLYEDICNIGPVRDTARIVTNLIKDYPRFFK